MHEETRHTLTDCLEDRSRIASSHALAEFQDKQFYDFARLDLC